MGRLSNVRGVDSFAMTRLTITPSNPRIRRLKISTDGMSREFFLDTLDSYHLISATPELRATQEAAMVSSLRAVRARFPGIRLVFNRGFEILPQVKDMVTAVAAESLYRGWDQGKKQYREVPANDREWLLGQLQTVRTAHGLPVIAIDYVAPAERDLAQ